MLGQDAMMVQVAAPRVGTARATARLRHVPIETMVFSGLALTTLALLAFGLPMLSPTLQVLLLGGLVAVLGLPHGALDPLIARRAGVWRTPLGFAAFNTVYLAIVVSVVLLWLVAPVLSLVAFLIVSALHFGSDWNADRGLWLRFLAGFGLLSVPAFSHPDQVGAAYVVLAGPGGAMVSGVQAGLAPLALAGLLVAAVAAVRQRPHESVEIVLASVLALACEPLVFFLVYFCALHSFRHLRAGFAEEHGGGRLPALIVVVYTVVPILAVGALLFVIGPSGDMPEQILQVLFIGLAGLTVPHMIVVSHEKRHQQKLSALPR